MRAKSGFDLLNNIQHWRTRAKEIRVIAETILERASREALLRVANDYELMAHRAEQRVKQKEPQIQD